MVNLLVYRRQLKPNSNEIDSQKKKKIHSVQISNKI